MKKLLLLGLILLFACTKEEPELSIAGKWKLVTECDFVSPTDVHCFATYPRIWEFEENHIFRYEEIIGKWSVHDNILMLTYSFIPDTVKMEIISLSKKGLILKQRICLRYFESD